MLWSDVIKTIKTGRLGFRDQLAVRELRPTSFVSSLNLMSNQCIAKRRGSILIQQNSHLRSRGFRCGQTACGVFQNSGDLISPHARKPVQKFIDCSPALEICEESGHRHTRTAKNPRTAHPIWVSFYRTTTGPVEHVSPNSIQLSRRLDMVPSGFDHRAIRSRGARSRTPSRSFAAACRICLLR